MICQAAKHLAFQNLVSLKLDRCDALTDKAIDAFSVCHYESKSSRVEDVESDYRYVCYAYFKKECIYT